jgi:hypothetical protein
VLGVACGAGETSGAEAELAFGEDPDSVLAIKNKGQPMYIQSILPDGPVPGTLLGARTDPAASGETGVDKSLEVDATVGVIAGVNGEPSPWLGKETNDTRIEPPQGAEEKVGDQPGEKTSGSVGTA